MATPGEILDKLIEKLEGRGDDVARVSVDWSPGRSFGVHVHCKVTGFVCGKRISLFKCGLGRMPSEFFCDELLHEYDSAVDRLREARKTPREKALDFCERMGYHYRMEDARSLRPPFPTTEAFSRCLAEIGYGRLADQLLRAEARAEVSAHFDTGRVLALAHMNGRTAEIPVGWRPFNRDEIEVVFCEDGSLKPFGVGDKKMASP